MVVCKFLMQISEKAFGKINISLNLTGEKENNYHFLVSLICFCNFYDIITVEESKKFDYEILNNINFGDSDLILKTIKMFCKKLDINNLPNLKITLDKRIPVGAGLGGGSADSAALIRALDKFLNLNLSTEKKMSIAKDIGSDVPACLLSKPLILTGYGDRYKEIENVDHKDIIIVFPNINASTKDIFSSINLDNIDKNESIYFENRIKEGIIFYNNNNNLNNYFSNDLERISTKKYPEIQKVKESILEVGSIFASMTGSGSACFGFFEKKDILKAKQKLETLNMGWKIISCQLMGSDN